MLLIGEEYGLYVLDMLIEREKIYIYFFFIEGLDIINYNIIKLFKLCLINFDELLKLI